MCLFAAIFFALLWLHFSILEAILVVFMIAGSAGLIVRHFCARGS